MNKNFDKCLSMLLVHEGGYVNHPKDPAGMTNLGVTKKTYDNYYNTNIDEQGMKQLTKADVEPIYRELYWLKTHCQELPSGVDWAVFDYESKGREFESLRARNFSSIKVRVSRLK